MINWIEWNDATLAIQAHAMLAVLGLVSGSIVMSMRKGTRVHRHTGRVFAIAAALTALSSFLIHEIRLWGPWSPIHLLALYVLAAAWFGVVWVRQGKIARHAGTMKLLFVSGFVVAGGFTLVPDRLLGEAFVVPLLQMLPGVEVRGAHRIAGTFPYIGIGIALWMYRDLLLGWARHLPFRSTKGRP